MRIAFHLATPPAPRPEVDAAVQELERLREAFGGERYDLYPGAVYRPWIRRRRLRPSQVERWMAADHEVDIHHVVSDRPLHYPILDTLRRPIIYRLLTPPDDLRALARLATRARIVVSAHSEAFRLRAAGIEAEAVAPGIDLTRFAGVAEPPDGPFTVLYASAPWTRRQFATKGLDPLLQALETRPAMRLILLGRGVLRRAHERRLDRRGMRERCEFIDATVRPETLLARTHVTVLAPSSPRVVKAYPHSLLEALAAGRPIVTSDRLAISEWVRDHGCGEVVEPDARSMGTALDRIAADYPVYARTTAGLDLSEFSIATCVSSYRSLYESALAAPGRTAIRSRDGSRARPEGRP